MSRVVRGLRSSIPPDPVVAASRPEIIVARLDEPQGPPPDTARLHAFIGVLTEYVGGILFEVDAEGRFLTVVTGDAKLLAAPVSELGKLNVRRLHAILGDDVADMFDRSFHRVLERGGPESVDYTLEVPLGRRSFRCETRLSPWSPDDAPTLILLIRDITEETELKAKLVEAERLAAMGLVAASVAHEIRQPLAFATTSVDVLARELERLGAAGPGPAGEALEHVRDAVRRLGGIAASVNLVAPDRQGESTTDVRRPVEAAIDLCASELQGRAKVSVDMPSLPRVTVNEGELCQVIANLLLNAAHAVDAPRAPAGPGRGREQGGHRIGVTARLEPRAPAEAAEGKPGTVRITVSDDGVGIPQAVVGRVFDPFFTTKAAGRGTGLGLFVARRIVERAGGALTIASTVGAGTIVDVVLPVATDPGPPSSGHKSPAVLPSRRHSVLVVDDEPSFLRSLQLLLEETHEVVVCLRSPDALEMVRAAPRRFDAILCDLSMPEIDGVAFHRHMEELGVAERFVLMTAGAFTPHGEAFLKDATCRSISKPFPLEKLLAILHPPDRR